MIELDLKLILKAEMGENTILRIHRDDIKVDAMLKQIQYNHLSDSIIHVDFIRIDLTKPIEVKVPVEIIGEAIEFGDITIEPSQTVNVEVEDECRGGGMHGHRWEEQPNTGEVFCHFCGILEKNYNPLEL